MHRTVHYSFVKLVPVKLSDIWLPQNSWNFFIQAEHRKLTNLNSKKNCKKETKIVLESSRVSIGG